MNSSPEQSPPILWSRVLTPLLFIAAGAITLTLLIKLSKKPEINEVKPNPIAVEFKEIKLQDHQVELTGYGRVLPLRRSDVGSERRAKVLKVNPKFKEGQVVAGEQVLVWLDDRDLRLSIKNLKQELRQNRIAIEKLKLEFEREKRTHKIRSELKTLLKKEWERLNALFQKGRIVSQKELDRTRREYLQASETLDHIQQSLDLHPQRLEELASKGALLEIQREKVQLDLERSRIRAPYSGRLSKIGLEVGKVVSPGEALFSISDESAMEVRIPLPMVDVDQWLDTDKSTGWYRFPREIPVSLRWLDGDRRGTGRALRLRESDTTNNTVEVVVHIDAERGFSANMFVEARIPGRHMREIFVVPTSAIVGQDTLYIAKPHEDAHVLEIRKPQWLKITDRFALAKQGLKNGDKIITTNLTVPIEGAPLKIVSKQDTLAKQADAKP